MLRARPNLRPLLKALGFGAVWLWFVQALGVGLLCFCGHCPTSAALGITASPDNELHACCRQHQDELAKAAAGKPMAGADQQCCAGGHELARTQAEPTSSAGIPQPLVQAAELPQPSQAVGARVAQATLGSWQWSRGPPGEPPKPLYLHNASLLI